MKTEIQKFTEKYEHLADDQNPAFMFSCIHTEILLKIANGEVDAKRISEYELANRGLGKDGKWVGFDESDKVWNIK